MSQPITTPPGPEQRGLPEEETLRRLLRTAGPRPPLPEDDLAAITSAARQVWERRYADRRRAPAKVLRFPAPSRWLALAATVVLALGLGWWLRPAPPATPPAVATVEVARGSARVRDAAGSASTLAVGTPVPPGATVETTAGEGEASGPLALRLAGGASLRVDAGTRLRLASATRIELESGAVYVDSGATGGDVAVWTAAGLFQEVGTQFEVRAEGDGAAATARLRVREGLVRLDRDGEPVTTAAGEELLVEPSGDLVRRPLAPYGPDWEWVLAAAPRLDLEGRTVREFLDWLARETGWQVELADPETAAIVDSVVLHGSIEHLSPEGSPAVVLASCGLGSRLVDGTLVVFVAGTEAR